MSRRAVILFVVFAVALGAYWARPCDADARDGHARVGSAEGILDAVAATPDDSPALTSGNAPFNAPLVRESIASTQSVTTSDGVDSERRITVIAMLADGAAISDARIEVLAAARRGEAAIVVASETTDATGSATLSCPDSGRRLLRGTRHSGEVVVQPLDVDATNDPIRLVFPADSRACLSGRILYANGVAATDVAVVVIPIGIGDVAEQSIGALAKAHSNATGLVDEHGDYACAGVSPGPVLACVRRWTDGATLDRRELRIEPAGSRLDLRLALCGTLRGRVLDRADRPLRSFVTAELWVEGSVASTIRSTTTDSATGSFELLELPAGEYVLRAREPRHELAESRIRIEPEGRVETTLHLDLGGTIRGRVDGPTGHPAQARLDVFRRFDDGERKIVEATTRPDGSFVADALPFGVYRVEVQSEEFASTYLRRIELKAEQPLFETALRLELGGSLAGRVAWRSGAPASRSGSIRIRSRAIGLRVLPVAIEEDGSFEVPRILSGTHDFELRCDGVRTELRGIRIDDQSRTDAVFDLSRG